MADYSEAYQQYKSEEARERREKDRGMTDERLQMCPSCGHMAHVAGECPSELTGPYAECDCGYEPAPPKAAPYTDEGEARDWVRAEESPDFVVWRLYEGGFCTGATTLPKEVEAAIRAPLEERIRELEVHGSALAAVDGERIEYLEAEVERLREALRTIASWGVDPANRAGELSLIFQYAERALATPSSTEGTDDEPTFDRLSMHRSEDWGTKEVEG